MKTGDRVVITGGPWVGYRGTVVKVNETVVRVRITHLNKVAVVHRRDCKKVGQ